LVWILTQSTANLSQSLSVLFCLFYVACVLGSIYEYRQNMATMEVLCYWKGGGGVTRGSFAAPIHLYMSVLYRFPLVDE